VRVYEQNHHFDLPSGTQIEVRQLVETDAYGTQVVKDSAYLKTYVGSGWLNLKESRDYLDPNNPYWVTIEADRIKKGREELKAGDDRGLLLLGAFTVDTQVQIGVLRYDPLIETYALAGVTINEGYVAEVDVLSGWTGLGIGKAMFYVALRHGLEIGHHIFGLDVVKLNTAALNFYKNCLDMQVMGDSEIMKDWPQTMNRSFVSGFVQSSLTALENRNTWLVPRA